MTISILVPTATTVAITIAEIIVVAAATITNVFTLQRCYLEINFLLIMNKESDLTENLKIFTHFFLMLYQSSSICYLEDSSCKNFLLFFWLALLHLLFLLIDFW